MTKKKETPYMWGMLLNDLERAIRTRELSSSYDYGKMYTIGMRTVEKLGAKRSDALPSGKKGADQWAMFDTACSEAHAEWSEYERLSRLFAPHLEQHWRIKYPNPKEDFHAAWVKAGEDR